MNNIISQFKETAIWSSSEAETLEEKGFTIFDFKESVKVEIAEIVALFMERIIDAEDIASIEEAEEWDQIGHWLALEMQGHGAGFFDSTNPTVKAISVKLENFYKFESVFEGDDGKLHINFFTYGTDADLWK